MLSRPLLGEPCPPHCGGQRVSFTLASTCQSDFKNVHQNHTKNDTKMGPKCLQYTTKMGSGDVPAKLWEKYGKNVDVGGPRTLKIELSPRRELHFHIRTHTAKISNMSLEMPPKTEPKYTQERPRGLTEGIQKGNIYVLCPFCVLSFCRFFMMFYYCFTIFSMFLAFLDLL